MDNLQYAERLKRAAKKCGHPDRDINYLLWYASNLQKLGLPVIFDINHLAQLLGYRLSFLMAISNQQHSFYREFTIPKKNGSNRTICEPLPSLKSIQHWILKEILEPASKHSVSPVAKAFIPGLSLRDNAKFHKGQLTVVCLDLHDFFGSITERQVYLLFRQLGYTTQLAKLMSELCVLDDGLPQGAPTSPMLSNLVFHYYDIKLMNFARERGLRYTRYADDLTFSGDINAGVLISFVKKLFYGSNYAVNDQKTKVLHLSSRQTVTGIVVNNKIQVPKDYRKSIRQEVYYLRRFGLLEHVKNIHYPKSPREYLYHLIGKINFVLMINKKDEEAQSYYDFVREQIMILQ